MTPETAQKALVFMDRVELRGHEVRVWTEVVAALQTLRDGKTPPADKPPKRRRGTSK